ncbi:MAG: helix-hairpin-helix domain-containing protein [Caldilineaceae bacterium]
MSTDHFNNRDVAALLDAVAARLQILDANRFRIIAFQNAAESIRHLGQDINAVHAAGELQSIQGVGKGIAVAIDELLTTGAVAEFDDLAAQVPDGVIAMMQVPDMGPKKAKRLWEELEITSVEQLRAAAEAGSLRGLKGFGAKSEEKILKGIELLDKRSDDRTPIGDARPLAEAMVAGLLDALPADAVTRVEIAGSLRRWRETIGDVDILCVSEQPAAVMEAFRALPQVSDVAAAGETKSSVILTTGLQVDLRVVDAQHWGAALQYFTGSKEHNVPVRELALKQGWSLNEYGLTATGKGDEPEGAQRFFAEEAELYAFLGLAWPAPELRENRGEIQAARSDDLPELITLADIRGELHGHTTWSDGAASIAEMAEAARPGLQLLECLRPLGGAGRGPGRGWCAVAGAGRGDRRAQPTLRRRRRGLPPAARQRGRSAGRREHGPARRGSGHAGRGRRQHPQRPAPGPGDHHRALPQGHPQSARGHSRPSHRAAHRPAPAVGDRHGAHPPGVRRDRHCGRDQRPSQPAGRE